MKTVKKLLLKLGKSRYAPAVSLVSVERGCVEFDTLVHAIKCSNVRESLRFLRSSMEIDIQNVIIEALALYITPCFLLQSCNLSPIL